MSAGARRFLDRVARPETRIGGCVVVVAHPDDETLGCGALMARLEDVVIVHVTDGAPRRGFDALRQGFPHAVAYAAARRLELETAVAVAGVPRDRLAGLGVPDQEAAANLAAIARALVPHLDGAEVVLTHAYEGGHPDHDAAAFAVASALRLIGPDRAPARIEMPFYRADATGPNWIRQRFAPGGSEATILTLDADARRRKAAMLAAHVTQRETLSAFGTADEAFRPAEPDFTRAPNGGRVLYDRYDWGTTSLGFLDQTERARRDLGLAAF